MACQDTYAKLLDACITFVGRSQDQGSWIRRSAKESLIPNGRDSPAIPVKEEQIDPSENASPLTVPETLKPSNSFESISQVSQLDTVARMPFLTSYRSPSLLLHHLYPTCGGSWWITIKWPAYVATSSITSLPPLSEEEQGL
jgi:hypothetical protein